MARQPLHPGTYGVINIKQVGPNLFQARTYFRHRNGTTSRPSARGASREAARNALRQKLTTMTTTATQGEVTRNSLVSRVAELYLAALEHQVSHGDLEPNTLRTYRSNWRMVQPYLGALRIFELEESVDVIDDMLKDLRVTKGYETAKKARTITSGLCGFAIRRKAMTGNPVRSVERLARTTEEKRAALDVVPDMTFEQITTMRHGLAAFAKTKAEQTDRLGRRLGRRGAVWTDLPDMADASLATGVRIGEVLALAGTDIFEFDEDGNEFHYGDDAASDEELLPGRSVAVTIDAHIIREQGKGLRRVQGRKSGRPGITVQVPDWSAVMFLRRRTTAGDGPLFPSFGGSWLDGDNTNKRLRRALDHAKLPWVSARVWRKTVGTLVGHALGEEAAAEQLGNTPAVARRHYVAQRRISTRGAAVLEVIKPKTDTKSTQEAMNDVHSSPPDALSPGRTVGAAGLEPATARNSEDLLQQ